MIIRWFMLIIVVSGLLGCTNKLKINKTSIETTCSRKVEEMKSLNKNRNKAYFLDYKRVYMDCINRG